MTRNIAPLKNFKRADNIRPYTKLVYLIYQMKETVSMKNRRLSRRFRDLFNIAYSSVDDIK